MPRNALRLTVTTVAVALAATACGATSGGSTDSAGTSGSAGKPLTGLRLMVPNSPGGGYDVTARTAAKVMEDAKIANSMEVFNLSGAGGTVGLARLVNEKGNGDLAMMMGLGVVGATYTNKATSKLSGTTPIARLIEEPSGIMVAKDSPFQTLDDLIAAWKANPSKVSVGGGSSPGGPDHLLPMQLAKTVGIDPRQVNFVSYDGGGELLPAVLGGKVAFGASGFGEFLDQVEAGQLRVLAVTSEAPIPALAEVPTLKSSGIDLVFTNWRGIVAPPGISDADKKVWIDALTKMHDSQGWKDEMKKRGWTDAFATGEEFGAFLKQQDTDVATILKQLGLA